MPFKKGDKRPPGSGRPKGGLNKVTKEAKAFAEQLVNDPDYQENLKKRILAGKAPILESYIWNKIVGKPKDEVDLTVNAPLFALPADYKQETSNGSEEGISEKVLHEGSSTDSGESN